MWCSSSVISIGKGRAFPEVQLEILFSTIETFTVVSDFFKPHRSRRGALIEVLFDLGGIFLVPNEKSSEKCENHSPPTLGRK